jgi:hypothetical protein
MFQIRLSSVSYYSATSGPPTASSSTVSSASYLLSVVVTPELIVPLVESLSIGLNV